MNRIYLDHAATTPLLPEARDAMSPWLGEGFGNPSSLHAEGRASKAAIDASREKFADAFGCLFGEVIFTGSGTEAANLAVVGAALKSKRRRVLLGAAEHHCVLHTKGLLEHLGYQVELIPVDREAVVHPDVVQGLLTDDVALVSVMHANNEFGSVNPVVEIAEQAHRVGAVFHVDAVQTFPGDWQVADLGADMVSVSAHKFYGPKAVGALYCRAGVGLQPLTLGGGKSARCVQEPRMSLGLLEQGLLWIGLVLIQ
ncbi:MAG: aminotransferase class V-fold PLP-dependent enzyme [Fimbriimonadaceae bacterium]